MKYLLCFLASLPFAFVSGTCRLSAQDVGSVYALGHAALAVYGQALGCGPASCEFKVERVLWGLAMSDTITVRACADDLPLPLGQGFAGGQEYILGLDYISPDAGYSLAGKDRLFPVASGRVLASFGSYPLGVFCAAYQEYRLLAQAAHSNSDNDVALRLKEFSRQSDFHALLASQETPFSFRKGERSSCPGCSDTSIASLASQMLYVGIPCPLEISVPEHSIRRYRLETDNGHISKDGKSIIPQFAGRARVCLYKKGWRRKLIFCQDFGVHKIMITPTINYYRSNDKVKEGVLSKYSKISASLFNYDIDTGYPIESYTLIVMRGGQVLSQVSACGGSLTPEAKEALRAAKAGSQVVFAGLTCQAWGRTEYVPPLVYYIVD